MTFLFIMAVFSTENILRILIILLIFFFLWALGMENHIFEIIISFVITVLGVALKSYISKMDRSIESLWKRIREVETNYLDRFDELKNQVNSCNNRIMDELTNIKISIAKLTK